MAKKCVNWNLDTLCIYKKCSKPFFDLLRIIPIHLIILKYCRQLPFQSKLAHCTSSCGRPLVLSLLLRDPVVPEQIPTTPSFVYDGLDFGHLGNLGPEIHNIHHTGQDYFSY